jgi:hypothetical protein
MAGGVISEEEQKQIEVLSLYWLYWYKSACIY